MNSMNWIFLVAIAVAVYWFSQKTIENFTMEDYADIITKTFSLYSNSYPDFSIALDKQGVTDKNINNYMLFHTLKNEINASDKEAVKQYVISQIK